MENLFLYRIDEQIWGYIDAKWSDSFKCSIMDDKTRLFNNADVLSTWLSLFFFIFDTSIDNEDYIRW